MRTWWDCSTKVRWHVSYRPREGITFNNDDVITYDTPRIVEGAACATFGRRQAKSLVRRSLASHIQSPPFSSHGSFQLAAEGGRGTCRRVAIPIHICDGVITGLLTELPSGGSYSLCRSPCASVARGKEIDGDGRAHGGS